MDYQTITVSIVLVDRRDESAPFLRGSAFRRMKREWVIGIRNQCQRAGVPFFFKQWAESTEEGR